MPTTVTPIFSNVVDGLRGICASQSDAVLDVAQRHWFLADIDSWDGDVVDIITIKDGFDREEPNQQYVDASGTEGVTGGAAAARTQVEYVALHERAQRASWASDVRSRFHAAARRRGHSLAEGVLGRVSRAVQDKIGSAGTE